MIVVDTTALADLLFNDGKLRESALKLQSVDPEWICTGLVRYELGNVAWKMMVFGGLEQADAQPGLEGAGEVLTEVVQEVDWLAVLSIAVEAGLSYYDAAHVWLARVRGLKLWTRDKQVLRECSDVAVAMPEV